MRTQQRRMEMIQLPPCPSVGEVRYVQGEKTHSLENKIAWRLKITDSQGSWRSVVASLLRSGDDLSLITLFLLSHPLLLSGLPPPPVIPARSPVTNQGGWRWNCFCCELGSCPARRQFQRGGKGRRPARPLCLLDLKHNGEAAGR